MRLNKGGEYISPPDMEQEQYVDPAASRAAARICEAQTQRRASNLN